MWSTMKRADNVVSNICNSVLQGWLHKLFQAPQHTHSLQNKPHLLLKSHIWDTHLHVRLRSHRPAIDLYRLGLEKYTSLRIFPSLPMFSAASLYDPFGRKGRAATKNIGQEITSSGLKKIIFGQWLQGMPTNPPHTRVSQSKSQLCN